VKEPVRIAFDLTISDLVPVEGCIGFGPTPGWVVH
jgi:hypothetical protein